MNLTTVYPPLAETHTDSGELVAINQFSIFIIGAGGFGGKREAPNLKVCVWGGWVGVGVLNLLSH